MIHGSKREIMLACILIGAMFCSAPYAVFAEITISPGQTCTSPKCHEQFGEERHVHPAMEGGECSACHTQQGEAHAFEFPAEGDELCYFCHEQFNRKKNQHPALEMGCTTCHNPHQSQTDFLLQADSLPSLCFLCHDDSAVKSEWVHGPASAGECTVCHNPHESDNSKLLVESPPALCFTCHAEAEEALENDKVVHGAVEEGCTLCHNPHGQDHQFLLNEDVPQLCFMCHGDIEETVTSARVKHGIVEKDKRCLNCHRPHTSNNDRLLILDPSEICYSCHDKEIETPTGPIRDMKTWVEEHEYPHGPVIDGDCTSCHSPHGSPYFRILKEQFPDGFYASFSEDTYKLCFGCHDSRFVLFEKTTKLTGFRDGPRNLHYLHVNKKFKGRVCTVCHDVHATDNPKHIKEKSRFGTWDMPIRFKQTATGGSCYPGCHKYQAYDREKPVLQKEE